MSIATVSLREISRNQKQLFEKVKKTKQPLVVTSKKEGNQVAIVSLEDLDQLERAKRKAKRERYLKSLLEIRSEWFEGLEEDIKKGKEEMEKQIRSRAL